MRLLTSRRQFALFLLPIAAASAFARPQESSPVAAQTVSITAFKRTEQLPFLSFLRAMETAKRLRSYAPDAEIQFKLRYVASPGQPVGSIPLQLSDELSAVSIPLSESGLFRLEELPASMSEEARLIAGAGAGTVEFVASVRSPNLPSNTRRMGDLRLECEMNWAMKKQNMPLLIKISFGSAGGTCHSSKIRIGFKEAARIAAAELVEDTRELKLGISMNGFSYFPPLYDERWGHDARLVLKFADGTDLQGQ